MADVKFDGSVKYEYKWGTDIDGFSVAVKISPLGGLIGSPRVRTHKNA